MEYKLNDGTLTIFLKGKINSSNSEETEEEIGRIIAENAFKSIVFDLSDLVYISSAGLRILLGVKQEHEDTKLVKVSEPIYEIFVMVGFDNVLTIEKQ